MKHVQNNKIAIRRGVTSSNKTNTPLLVWNKVIRTFCIATTEVCMKVHYFWKWPLTYAQPLFLKMTIDLRTTIISENNHWSTHKPMTSARVKVKKCVGVAFILAPMSIASAILSTLSLMIVLGEMWFLSQWARLFQRITGSENPDI